ncbi:transaldolase [Uliginosibacterium sp. sgz301328]|uniref:transaldolase n=1 Tax=Uliginosibacterium sp. sgz301328 TaxID=3243764 RepID=UPI00359DD10C
MNRVKDIARFGQQVWLDSLSRQLIASGRLRRLIDEDGIAGVTSNPAIFEHALTHDASYRDALAALPAGEPEVRFEAVAIPDIQAACDIFRPLYDTSGGEAGFVSFEVSPRLAHDADGTIAAARRLWAAIGRPNAMIKIPATGAGLVAIEESIAAGINVNVTLMFSHRHVRDVFEAYCLGLQRRSAAGLPIDRIRSVASVFVSRWDTLLDPLLATRAPELAGKVAISLARRAYQFWKHRFGPGSSFAALAARGAQPQRLLWASTGVKNPAYRDTLYVESLIGPHTVDTVPESTLEAFRDHGEASSQLEQGVEDASAVIDHLARIGIDLEAHADALQEEGLASFAKAFSALLERAA